MLWSSAVLHEPCASTLLAAEPIGPKVRTWIDITRVFYYRRPSWDRRPVESCTAGTAAEQTAVSVTRAGAALTVSPTQPYDPDEDPWGALYGQGYFDEPPPERHRVPSTPSSEHEAEGGHGGNTNATDETARRNPKYGDSFSPDHRPNWYGDA